MTLLLAALFETLLSVLINLALFALGVCLVVVLFAVYANWRCRIEEERGAKHFAATDSMRAELEEAEEKPYRVIGGARRGPERVL